MKRLIRASLMTSLVVGLMAFAAAGAKADPVMFSTQGCFQAGACPGPTVLAGSLAGSSLTVVGVGPVTVNTPVGVDLATFTLVTTGSSTFASPFTLTITQTNPAAPAGSFTATLSGTVSTDSGFVIVTFDQSQLVLGTVTYTLANVNAQRQLLINAINTGPTTRLSAIVTGGAIPEPTSMLLLGTGLAGVAGAVRRKLKTRNLN